MRSVTSTLGLITFLLTLHPPKEGLEAVGFTASRDNYVSNIDGKL